MQYECEVCSKTFATMHKWDSHVLDAHGIKHEGFVCELCDKRVPQRAKLAHHKARCRGKVDTLTCKHCMKTFAHSSSRCRHESACNNTASTATLDPLPASTASASPPSATEPVPSRVSDSDTASVLTTQANNNTTIHGNSNQVSFHQEVHVTYIQFPFVGTDPMCFGTSHIHKEARKAIFKTATVSDLLEALYEKILEDEANFVVEKHNEKRAHSKVRTTDGDWVTMPDSHVYHKVGRGVSLSALELSKEHKIPLAKDHSHRLGELLIDMELPTSRKKDVYELPELVTSVLDKLKAITSRLTRLKHAHLRTLRRAPSE